MDSLPCSKQSMNSSNMALNLAKLFRDFSHVLWLEITVNIICYKSVSTAEEATVHVIIVKLGY